MDNEEPEHVVVAKSLLQQAHQLRQELITKLSDQEAFEGTAQDVLQQMWDCIANLNSRLIYLEVAVGSIVDPEWYRQNREHWLDAASTGSSSSDE